MMTSRDREMLELLVQQIEQGAIDIAPTYQDWLAVIFALATDLGEEGRTYFHRISRQYSRGRYDAAACDKKYTHALAQNRGKIHLGSIFHLAAAAGIDTRRLHAQVLQAERDRQLSEQRRLEEERARQLASEAKEQQGPQTGGAEHRQDVDGAGGAADESSKFGSDRAISLHTGARDYNIAQAGDEGGTAGDRYADDRSFPPPPVGDNGQDADDSLVMGSEPMTPLPFICQASYQWPTLLQRALDPAEPPAYRDVLFLGTVTAMGAAMGWALMTNYSRTMQYPNLQTFVVAPSASGKGILGYVRHIVEPIHRKLKDQYEQKRRAYLRERKAYENLGNRKAEVDEPQAPPLSLFFVPGNVTGTGIQQLIIDNEGRGFIFEVEADTVSTALAGDYGHWSDMLRKCFENDGLSFFRRTNQEYKECKKTFVSVLLSGTPGQVAPFIPSAENGLFSRQVFYYMPASQEFRNQFDQNDSELHSHYQAIGRTFFELQQMLTSSGNYTLLLSVEQKEAFNQVFSQLFARSVEGSEREMSSFVIREAIDVLRFMLIVAMLRATEPTVDYIEKHNGNRPDHLLYDPTLLEPTGGVNQSRRKSTSLAKYALFISEDDFEECLAMAVPLYEHAQHILSMLKSTVTTRRTTSDQDVFYQRLPQEFVYADVKALGEELNIPESTYHNWIVRWTKRGRLKYDRKTAVYTKYDAEK